MTDRLRKKMSDFTAITYSKFSIKPGIAGKDQEGLSLNKITKSLYDLQFELVKSGLSGVFTVTLSSKDFKAFTEDTGRVPVAGMVSIISSMGQIDVYDEGSIILVDEPKTPLSYDTPSWKPKVNNLGKCWDCYSGFCRQHKTK